MFLTDIFEQTNKPVTICFGRMNPPTLGHKQLLDTVANSAGGNDFYIFATKTHKLPDNPLSYDEKYKFLVAMFPEYKDHIVYNPELKTIMQVAQWLYEKGYTELNFVAGSDRIPEFEKLLKSYNGKGQPGDKGYYIFTNINMISAGERDADAEGLAGISASKARAAAKAGNFEEFVAKTGAGDLAKPLYDAVRAAMEVSEDVASDSQSTTSPIHGSNFKEEATGVGVVAKNRKMARDPRYSMSITKDVKPTTPKNMLRALRLAEEQLSEKWSQKQRKAVNCDNPKGFSQKAHCAGRKARQAGKKTKSGPLSESKRAELASIPMIKKFLPIAKAELKLERLPKIKIQRHVEVHDGQATFGRFVNGEATIYVGIADRHPVDVLRTLAHELVHWQQYLDDRIKPDSGETGSQIENEAHAVAGVLMRHFNKKYPDAIKLDNIELKEDRDLVSGQINYSAVLNPIAWDNDQMLPQVRDRLLKISGEFVKYLDIPGFQVQDVVLTGSMANYNWTKYSDFDLHVITNYSDLECDNLAEAFYRAKKDLWNNYHDITIGGYEVEMYVEDSAKPPVSAGVYSILDNKWLKKPDYSKPEIDKSAVNAKANDILEQVKQAINSADSVSDIQRIKDKLRHMRRAGLDASGEFSVENLTYKVLRNMGVLDKLSKVQTQQQDKKLSLPESKKKIAVNEDVNSPKQLIRDITSRVPSAKQIWFYGSRARGKYRPNSDYDILVLVPDDIVGNDFLDIQLELEKLSHNYANYDIQASHSWNNLTAAAQQEGKLLWSQISEKKKRKKKTKRFVGTGYGYYNFAEPMVGDSGGEGVSESLDQPYALRWSKGDYGDVDALAELPDGTYLSIMFERPDDPKSNLWHVQFDRDNSQEITGKGDAQRIFATVLSAIKVFVKKRRPRMVYFSAVKSLDFRGTRTRLYDRLVQKYATQLGYKITREEHIDSTEYYLIRQDKTKQQGVAEDTKEGNGTTEHFNGIDVYFEDYDNGEILVQAMAGGKELGYVLFVEEGKYLVPEELEVNEKYRSQGIAKTMYDYVKSKGYTIKRSPDQTDAGAGYWDKHRPGQEVWEQGVAEGWSEKYKKSINCSRPRGFSQRAHCQGRKKK